MSQLYKKYFPNTSTNGYYDFLNQTVTLNSWDFIKLQALKGQSEYLKTHKIMPLCQHEYTHWLDSTSTLWGIKFLYDLYKTYDIEDYKEFLKGNDNFNKLFNSMLEIRKHNFFTCSQSYDEITNTIPWKYKYKYNIIENKYILPMVYFLNKDDYSKICHVPISLVSILEAAATAQELEMKMRLIVGFLHDGEKIVEAKSLERSIVKQLYEPLLTEYSVAVHIVSNSLQVKDILDAYSVCSVLCRFVLNFPDEYFEKISLENNIGSIEFITEQTLPLIYNTLKEKDISLLFFLIAQKLKDYPILKFDNETIQNSIISVLATFSIEINEKFFKSVTEEYLRHYTYFNSYDYLPIEEITKAGYENFDKLGVFGQRFYNFHDLITPQALLGDDTESFFFRNYINSFSQRTHAEHLIDVKYAINQTIDFLTSE